MGADTAGGHQMAKVICTTPTLMPSLDEPVSEMPGKSFQMRHDQT